MSSFNSDLIQKRVYFGDGEPSLKVNTVDNYRNVSRSEESYFIGIDKSISEGLSFVSKEKIIPKNTLEKFKFKIKDGYDGFIKKVWLFADLKKCQYNSWDDYIKTISYEYDTEKFLSLLLLHESAGLYIGRRCQDNWPLFNVVFDMTKVINGNPLVSEKYEENPYMPSSLSLDLLRYKGNTWAERVSNTWIYKYNPTPYVHVPDFSNPIDLEKYPIRAQSPKFYQFHNLNEYGYSSAIDDDKQDDRTIAALRFQNYLGADIERIKAFLFVLSTFRERCLAEILDQAFFMLDVAKLTDLDTVRTMYQKFTMSPMSILGKIFTNEKIQINESGLIYQEVYNWDQFSNVKLRLSGKSGKVYDLTIPQYLQIQFESVLWLIMDNLNKLEARIGQLEKPTEQLKAEAPIPFLLDPYENPFLIYDAKMSDALKKPTFTNVAASQAQQPIEFQRGVTNVVIPKQFYDDAPTIRTQLMRTTSTPGGAIVNMRELTGGNKEANNAPWLLAAFAAGAAFLAMK